MPKSFGERLQAYARLTIRAGVNVQPGQELLLTAGVENVEFTRLLVREAYEAGAKNVLVNFVDDANSLSRLTYGHSEAIEYAPQWYFDGTERALKEGAARLVVADSDPQALKPADPAKVAAHSKALSKAAESVMGMTTRFEINWCIVGAASKAWARLVFPGLNESEAVERLWDAILNLSRVDDGDAVETWKAHQDSLVQKQDWLNTLGLVEVHFQGPGTDLHVGLADGQKWNGGWGVAKNGVKCSPNIPTEEVFGMPHSHRVSGYVSSTKPLSVRGQVVDGILMEFDGGKVVKATATQGQDTLTRLLDTDEGARRLGEVALVPDSGKVSQSGVLFYNTLFDENAACHIALGRSYSENLPGYESFGEEGVKERGSNNSLIHVDWMIGSKDVDVMGVRADGSRVPVLKSGEWA